MSAKPVLYYNPRSPPCRSVLLTAAALGIELECCNVNLKQGEHLTAEFLKLNPQHTIPVLNDNDNIVSDSHVICAYLVDKYAKNDALYPKAAEQRRLVDTRLYFDCGHLFPRVRLIVEPVIYFGAANIPAEHISYMQKAYDGLEKCLLHDNYLCGQNLTIADLCCVTSVSTAAAFAPIDSSVYPKTLRWLERMQDLPYYQTNNQNGLDLLVKFVNDILAERQNAK